MMSLLCDRASGCDRLFTWAVAFGLGLLAWALPAPARAQTAIAVSTSADARALVDRYCVTCHNQRLKTAGLALDAMDVDRVPEQAEAWEKVVRRLRTGLMPPAGSPRPDAATHDALTVWLESALDRAAASAPDPGQVALRRMNRTEYRNAIRDLLAIDVDTSLLLPPDDSSGGFDNNADVLRASPALLERYLAAAGKISALAVGNPDAEANTDTYRAAPDASQTQHVEGLPLGTRGGILVRHNFPLDGEYVIRVKLLETATGAIRGLDFRNDVEILIDGERVHLAEIGGPQDFVASANNAWEALTSIGTRLTARVQVKAGPRDVGATFLQKSAGYSGLRYQVFDRSNVDTTDWTGLPHVESITIVGPFQGQSAGDTPSRQRIFTCRPAGPADEGRCARQILATFARRAYRQPVTDAELGELMALYEPGRRARGFEAGIERAIRGILASPRFVFRLEEAPAATTAAPHPVSEIELASRLSFFLWSSIPDDELIEVAGRGALRSGLEQQVRRMLADHRAGSLVTEFAGQWLQLRNLRSSIPDQNDFPNFDDNLREAFRRETELLFESVMREDRNVLDLLRADYTFVNERSARHYGMPNVYGSHFRRVPVRDEARRGLLGHGSMLLVTSHPDRTSPVQRGQWILENLLGTPTPPPPPNVPALPGADAAGRPQTMREQMTAHRASPACSSCHRLIDPLGLALENFDAVGAWRTLEAGRPIDASGEIADGTHVNGPVELREALLKRPDVLAGTLVEKLLTYALGRGLTHADMPVIRSILRESAAHDYRFSSIVLAIVRSTPFQMRKAEPPGTAIARR